MSSVSTNSVVIQDHSSGDSRWLLFEKPIQIIQAHNIDDVLHCLELVDEFQKKEYYVVGFLSYEASAAIDSNLISQGLQDFPYLWFGVYTGYQEITLPEPATENFELGEWQASVNKSEYYAAIEKIKQHIYSGETYQVNYTHRLRTDFSGDSYAFFNVLYKSQQSKYSAYLDIGKYKICSASPEIFFSCEDGEIVSKPMKGTLKRGLTNSQDISNRDWLYHSQKNRAENVMIVDMIRNDLGRIAEPGSVKVEKLFSVEKYQTVFQMTSTISAKTTTSVTDAIKNMFPCASITGAPKVKTMEIIKQLEKGPRGIYTGSIGYIAPDGKSQFNVAIRTVVIDSESGSAEYGVGGGITWYSESQDEYEECKVKASVLTFKSPAFDIIESILWEPALGYYLLDKHLDRLCDSAQYFNFSVSRDDVRNKILAYRLDKSIAQKIRVIVSKVGSVEIQSAPVHSAVGVVVGMAKNAIQSDCRFLYHKTSHRAIYEAALEGSPEYQDVILWNEKCHITESSIANIVVNIGGEFYTPPVSDGLLGGVYRGYLIEQGVVKEASIPVDSLINADNLYLVNSVRGWMGLVRSDNKNEWIVNSERIYQEPALKIC